MATLWETETDDGTHVVSDSVKEAQKSFTEATWDAMSIPERAERAKLSGRSGKLGSKSWAELTPDERASIVDPEKRPAKLDYQIKAHVVLEDSSTEKWGMVKYLEAGTYTLEASDGELVGSWSVSPADGLIHAFLETPLTALVDKAVQSFAEYAEKRRVAASTPKTPKTRTTRTPKVTQIEPVANEDLTTISSLRKLLGK